MICGFFFSKEKEQDKWAKKRHNGKFRFFAHDLIINYVHLQMSKNKNQMPQWGIWKMNN